MSAQTFSAKKRTEKVCPVSVRRSVCVAAPPQLFYLTLLCTRTVLLRLGTHNHAPARAPFAPSCMSEGGTFPPSVTENPSRAHLARRTSASFGSCDSPHRLSRALRQAHLPRPDAVLAAPREEVRRAPPNASPRDGSRRCPLTTATILRRTGSRRPRRSPPVAQRKLPATT